jgi:hemerythrin superfamily protein
MAPIGFFAVIRERVEFSRLAGSGLLLARKRGARPRVTGIYEHGVFRKAKSDSFGQQASCRYRIDADSAVGSRACVRMSGRSSRRMINPDQSARGTSFARDVRHSKGGTMDAITLLKQDHRQVEQLFKAFEGVAADKSEIASEVCRLLTIHAQIEEEIFYPAVREALTDDVSDDLLDEAEVEHDSAKALIAQIEELGDTDELFEAKVKVLGEYIRHHVKEEESELFPRVKESELNLERVGAELERRKKVLLEDAIQAGGSVAAVRARDQNAGAASRK